MMDINGLTELAQRIMQVADTKKRYKAAENLQQKIVGDIGGVISACSDLIEENTTLRFGGYLNDKRFIHYQSTEQQCIYLLTDHLRDIEEYENDTEERRAERKQKLEEYRGTVTIQLPPKEVIYNVREGTTKVIRKISPDLIYCQHGIYRQYSEICRTFEFRLCRKIQRSNGGDLKTMFQKVCLYIALKNERAMMSEELRLLGVDAGEPQQEQEPKLGQHGIPEVTQKDDMAASTEIAEVKPKRTINETTVGSWFIAKFKGSGQNYNYLKGNMIPDLEQDMTDFDFAKIAYLIFNSKYYTMTRSTFKDFYRDFCDAVGCVMHKGYYPSKLRDVNFANRYYYLEQKSTTIH